MALVSALRDHNSHNSANNSVKLKCAIHGEQQLEGWADEGAKAREEEEVVSGVGEEEEQQQEEDYREREEQQQLQEEDYQEREKEQAEQDGGILADCCE